MNKNRKNRRVGKSSKISKKIHLSWITFALIVTTLVGGSFLANEELPNVGVVNEEEETSTIDVDYPEIIAEEGEVLPDLDAEEELVKSPEVLEIENDFKEEKEINENLEKIAKENNPEDIPLPDEDDYSAIEDPDMDHAAYNVAQHEIQRQTAMARPQTQLASQIRADFEESTNEVKAANFGGVETFSTGFTNTNPLNSDKNPATGNPISHSVIITDVKSSGSTLVIDGWATIAARKHMTSSSTHRHTLWLKETSTNKWRSFPTTLVSRDATDYYRYGHANGGRNKMCATNTWNTQGTLTASASQGGACNFNFKNVGFQAKVDLTQLSKQDTYQVYLKTEFIGRAAAQNISRTTVVYSYTPSDVNTVINKNTTAKTHSKFSGKSFDVKSIDLYARGMPGATQGGLVRANWGKANGQPNIPSNCSTWFPYLYFSSNGAVKRFNKVKLNKKTTSTSVAENNFLLVGTVNHTSCLRSRPTAKEGNARDVWIGQNMIYSLNDPMQIVTSTSSKVTYRYLNENGQSIRGDSSKTDIMGRTFNQPIPAIAGYEYVSQSGADSVSGNTLYKKHRATDSVVTVRYRVKKIPVNVHSIAEMFGGSDFNIAGLGFQIGTSKANVSINGYNTEVVSGVVANLSTGNNGQDSVSLLPGTYYVGMNHNSPKARSLARDFMVHNAPIAKITVAFNGKKVDVKLRLLAKRVQYKIKAEDPNKKPIAGVQFTLDHNVGTTSTKKKQVVTTDSTGFATFNSIGKIDPATIVETGRPIEFKPTTGTILSQRDIPASASELQTYTTVVIKLIKKDWNYYADIRLDAVDIETTSNDDNDFSIRLEMKVDRIKEHNDHSGRNTDVTFRVEHLDGPNKYKASNHVVKAKDIKDVMTLTLADLNTTKRTPGSKDKIKVSIIPDPNKPGTINFTGPSTIETEMYTGSNKTLEFTESVKEHKAIFATRRTITNGKYDAIKLDYEYFKLEDNYDDEVTVGYGIDFNPVVTYKNDRELTAKRDGGQSLTSGLDQPEIKYDYDFFDVANHRNNKPNAGRSPNATSIREEDLTDYSSSVKPKETKFNYKTKDKKIALGGGELFVDNTDDYKNIKKSYEDIGRELRSKNLDDGVIYTKIWSDAQKGDTKDFNFQIASKNKYIGANRVNLTKDYSYTVKNRMVGTIGSKSIEEDTIIIIPVLTSDPFEGYKANKHGIVAPENITPKMMEKINKWNERP